MSTPAVDLKHETGNRKWQRQSKLMCCLDIATIFK